MPGYDILTVETMKPGLLCPECGFVLRDAVQTDDGTRLCLTCFKEVAKNPARTSQKTGFVLQDDSYNPDRAVRKEINLVLVYCRFKNHGCPWEGCLQHFESHVLDCKYRPVKCPNHGCSQLLSREQMDKHIDTECIFRQIYCDDCGHTMPAAELPEHRNTCPEYTIDCSECGTPVKRKDLFAHLINSCPTPTCTVPGCEKKLSRTSTQSEPNSVASHILNPLILFQHVLTLVAVISDVKTTVDSLVHDFSNRQGSPRNTVHPADLTRVHAEMQRSIKHVTDQLESLKHSTTGVKDKNLELNIKDVHSKLHQMDEKLKQQQQSLQRIQSQQSSTVLGSWAGTKSYQGEEMATSRIVQLEKKLEETERQTAMMKVHISELELQLQASLASTHNGSFLWRVPDISRRRRDAIEERITSIYSPPFYTGRNGYKMCIRAYLNGDGIGYKTHLSIFFVLMKGEYDPLLKWPFECKVSLILVDQNHRKHIVQTFKPTPESSSFQQPHSDMNVASGCPQFAKLNVLDDENYVKDDVLYMKCIIDTSRIFHP